MGLKKRTAGNESFYDRIYGPVQRFFLQFTNGKTRAGHGEFTFCGSQKRAQALNKHNENETWDFSNCCNHNMFTIEMHERRLGYLQNYVTQNLTAILFQSFHATRVVFL